MYALVEIKGKQYKAEKGATLRVDLFTQEKGTSVEFESVLLISDEKTVKVGAPYVTGAKVKTTILDTVKGEKVKVLKFKRRKSYMRTQGHRQQYSMLKVEDISGV